MAERETDIVDNSPMSETAHDVVGEAERTAHGAAAKAEEKARELRAKAQERADAGVEKAAERVATAAEKLRERADQSSGIPAEAEAIVADTMQRTAGYLKEHDSAEILGDVQAYVRAHPMRALAGAAIGGFILARVLR